MAVREVTNTERSHEVRKRSVMQEGRARRSGNLNGLMRLRGRGVVSRVASMRRQTEEWANEKQGQEE